MEIHEIPRNYKGESRILNIFSIKALMYTAIGIGIGLIFVFIFDLVGLRTVGIVIAGILAIFGFVIGTFKIPETKKFEITRKTGGEYTDDIIKRWIKFKRKKNTIYISK